MRAAVVTDDDDRAVDWLLTRLAVVLRARVLRCVPGGYGDAILPRENRCDPPRRSAMGGGRSRAQSSRVRSAGLPCVADRHHCCYWFGIGPYTLVHAALANVSLNWLLESVTVPSEVAPMPHCVATGIDPE